MCTLYEGVVLVTDPDARWQGEVRRRQLHAESLDRAAAELDEEELRDFVRGLARTEHQLIADLDDVPGRGASTSEPGQSEFYEDDEPLEAVTARLQGPHDFITATRLPDGNDETPGDITEGD